MVGMMPNYHQNQTSEVSLQPQPQGDIGYQNNYDSKGDVLFPFRLHEMLDDAENKGFSSVVSWLPDCRSFKVHDKEVFESLIMKRYFDQQTKYKSFLRQLNMWGFERHLDSPSKGAYTHQYFVRGKPSLCCNMIRTKKKKQKKVACCETISTPNQDSESSKKFRRINSSYTPRAGGVASQIEQQPPVDDDSPFVTREMFLHSNFPTNQMGSNFVSSSMLSRHQEDFEHSMKLACSNVEGALGHHGATGALVQGTDDDSVARSDRFGNIKSTIVFGNRELFEDWEKNGTFYEHPQRQDCSSRNEISGLGVNLPFNCVVEENTKDEFEGMGFFPI